MKKMLVVLLFVVASILFAGCNVAPTVPEPTAIPIPTVSQWEEEINLTCRAAAESVYTVFHPQYEEKVTVCIDVLNKEILSHGDGWPMEGERSFRIADKVRTQWGFSTYTARDRVLAAMQLTRYDLEDNGVLPMNPEDQRGSPAATLKGAVLEVSPYPWTGTIPDGMGLIQVRDLVCGAYTRTTNCDGSILWTSATKQQYVIIGNEALNHMDWIPGLPYVQPGDGFAFGSERVIMSLAVKPVVISYIQEIQPTDDGVEKVINLIKVVSSDGIVSYLVFDQTLGLWVDYEKGIGQ